MQALSEAIYLALLEDPHSNPLPERERGQEFQLRFWCAGRRARTDTLTSDFLLCLSFHGGLLPHGFAFHALRTRGADRAGLDLAYTA